MEPKKVELHAAQSNGATFVIRNEDHTLGNVLTYVLSKKGHDTGYSVPHPSEAKINLRVQSSGTEVFSTEYPPLFVGMSPTEALHEALKETIDICTHVMSTFESAFNQFQEEKEDEKRNTMTD